MGAPSQPLVAQQAPTAFWEALLLLAVKLRERQLYLRQESVQEKKWKLVSDVCCLIHSSGDFRILAFSLF